MLYVRVVPLTAAASRTSNFLVKTAKGARFVNECANPRCTGMLNSVVESVGRVHRQYTGVPSRMAGTGEIQGSGDGDSGETIENPAQFSTSGRKRPLLYIPPSFGETPASTNRLPKYP